MDLLNGPWRRELARLPWGVVLLICAIAGFGLVGATQRRRKATVVSA